jgi:tellurite resistance-related uncharacterized protein
MAKSLPELEAYRRTSVFDEGTIPSGLLRRHTTKAGVWGRIHVLAGELRYRVLEPQVRETRLGPGQEALVEPEIPHEVEPAGAVRFYVEFLREAETEAPAVREGDDGSEDPRS